jgi:hypothetical protein
MCYCECVVEGKDGTCEVADEVMCYKEGERVGGSVVEVGWCEVLR